MNTQLFGPKEGSEADEKPEGADEGTGGDKPAGEEGAGSEDGESQ